MNALFSLKLFQKLNEAALLCVGVGDCTFCESSLAHSWSFLNKFFWFRNSPPLPLLCSWSSGVGGGVRLKKTSPSMGRRKCRCIIAQKTLPSHCEIWKKCGEVLAMGKIPGISCWGISRGHALKPGLRGKKWRKNPPLGNASGIGKDTISHWIFYEENWEFCSLIHSWTLQINFSIGLCKIAT